MNADIMEMGGNAIDSEDDDAVPNILQSNSSAAADSA